MSDLCGRGRLRELQSAIAICFLRLLYLPVLSLRYSNIFVSTHAQTAHIMLLPSSSAKGDVGCHLTSIRLPSSRQESGESQHRTDGPPLRDSRRAVVQLNLHPPLVQQPFRNVDAVPVAVAPALQWHGSKIVGPLESETGDLQLKLGNDRGYVIERVAPVRVSASTSSVGRAKGCGHGPRSYATS